MTRSWLVVLVVAPLVLAALLSVLILAVELVVSIPSITKSESYDRIDQTFLVGDARVFHMTTTDGKKLIKFSSTKHKRYAFASPSFDFSTDIEINEKQLSLNNHAEASAIGLHAGMSSALFLTLVREFQGESFRVVQCKPKGFLVQWFAVSKVWSVEGLGSWTAKGPDALLSGKLLFVSTADTCCMISLPQAFFAFLGYGICLFPLTWIACSVCFKRLAGARPEGDAPEGVVRQ